MDCLKISVKAGFKDADQLGKDTDFDSLRDRKDFKEFAKAPQGISNFHGILGGLRSDRPVIVD